MTQRPGRQACMSEALPQARSRAALVGLCAAALTLLSTCHAHPQLTNSPGVPPQQPILVGMCAPPTNGICLRVVSGMHLRGDQDVEVFVLTARGEQVGTTRTDGDGFATFAVSPDNGGFVMAETVSGFVTGVRLRPNSRQYFITSCGVEIP